MKSNPGHTSLVTMFSDLIRICAGYLSHMGIRTVSTPGGQYGGGPATLPRHYHRAVSVGAWLGLMTAGSLCWVAILSSI